MLEFDHIAITVSNLDESISFYVKLGYELQEQFNDNEYKWAALKLDVVGLEIFQPLVKVMSRIEHIAYRFNQDDGVLDIVSQLGYSKDMPDVFYGDLNRKSFFIRDNNGISVQFIKKKSD